MSEQHQDTEGLPEVPEWIAEKIELREDRDIQDHHIIEIITEADRPFVSCSYVASDTDITADGMRPRLAELEDIGVLDSAPGAGGDVYWIHNEESNWPIPPDVTIEEIDDADVEDDDDISVSELTERADVQLALLALGFGLVQGTLLSVALTLTLLNLDITIPDYVAQTTLFAIIIFAFGTVFSGVAALVTFLLNRRLETSVRQKLSRGRS